MSNIINKLASLEKQAADNGFAWPNAEMILDQVQSECQEIRDVISKKEGRERMEEEVGDLLHAAFCLCFFMGFDAEIILSQSANKFEKRLLAVFKIANEQGYRDLKDESIETLMRLWNLAKQQDNS